jgi:serine/threonine-protein kinase
LAQIVAQSISTGERTVLVEGGSDAHYLPTGHLVYAFEDGLFAVVIDPDSLTVFGGAVPLVQEVRRNAASQTGAASYGISEDGTLVYVSGGVGVVERTLAWVDRDGREEPLDAPPRAYTYPRISPDGTKVALDVRDQELDIWIWDLARETLTRLTFDPGEDEFPVWSPDGRRIAFSSTRGGGASANTDLFWRFADGTGSVERLAEYSGQIFPSSFLPDATGILVRSTPTGNNDDISIFLLDGEQSLTPVLQTAFEERNAEISPDGRWLAYLSNESGSEEIFVRPFPDTDSGRWQVSTGGGIQPLWARDGQELFYRNGEAVMVVSIQTDPSFTVGNPEVVFEGPYLGAVSEAFNARAYDVSPDGERFLMIRPLESAVVPEIVIVQNWLEELNRLAPPLQ